MGVLILGLAGMGLATDRLALLKPGEGAELAGYTWRLDHLESAQGPNFTARRATVSVLGEGGVAAVLMPERRSFPVGRTTTTEAAIHTTWLADLYAVLGDERDGAAVLRLHHNPLAPWIWIGAAIMALGGALSLSDRRVRVSAPAPKKAAAAVRPGEARA
jgi:cytochrome c-type biogenesis protein CcmF